MGPMIFRRLTPIGRVMRSARRRLEREGWSQASRGGATGPGPCAAWAICLATHKLKDVPSDVAILAFANHNDLPFRKPDYTGSQRTTSWNDTPGRTKAEVLAAFRKAEAAETLPGLI